MSDIEEIKREILEPLQKVSNPIFSYIEYCSLKGVHEKLPDDVKKMHVTAYKQLKPFFDLISKNQRILDKLPK